MPSFESKIISRLILWSFVFFCFFVCFICYKPIFGMFGSKLHFGVSRGLDGYDEEKLIMGFLSSFFIFFPTFTSTSGLSRMVHTYLGLWDINDF